MNFVGAMQLPNDAEKHLHWRCCFTVMCARNRSGHKSNTSARLAITVLKSVGRILPTLFLSLARPWIESRPNHCEYQRENGFFSRGPPDGRICAGTRMAATGTQGRRQLSPRSEEDRTSRRCPICKDRGCKVHLLARFDASGSEGVFGIGLVGGPSLRHQRD